MSKEPNKHVKAYRERLVDKENKNYLDKLINHYKKAGSPFPTGTYEEIEKVTRRFEWYQKDVCCSKMTQRDVEAEGRLICEVCFTEISVNGQCICD